MYRKLTWAAAAILALAPLEAEAAMLSFSFETNDTTFVVSGELTVSNTPDSAGGYDVTGISGAVSGPNGGALSLVANPTPSEPYNNGAWIYDNVLFTSAPWVDNSGLLFATGGYDYNLYSSGPLYYLSSYNPAGTYNPGQAVGHLRITPIPEPATWLMMGLGFAGLGAAGSRAKRREPIAALA